MLAIVPPALRQGRPIITPRTEDLQAPSRGMAKDGSAAPAGNAGHEGLSGRCPAAVRGPQASAPPVRARAIEADQHQASKGATPSIRASISPKVARCSHVGLKADEAMSMPRKNPGHRRLEEVPAGQRRHHRQAEQGHDEHFVPGEFQREGGQRGTISRSEQKRSDRARRHRGREAQSPALRRIAGLAASSDSRRAPVKESRAETRRG